MPEITISVNDLQSILWKITMVSADDCPERFFDAWEFANLLTRSLRYHKESTLRIDMEQLDDLVLTANELELIYNK